MEEKHLGIDGKRISYIEEGKGEVLVLVHGWFGSSAQGFKSIIPELSKYYHVIAPNFPGYGNSEELKGKHTIDAYVDFLKAFLDKKGLEKINLLGSSFGGTICLKFIGKYPNQVKKLILQGTPTSDLDFFKRIIAYLFRSKQVQKYFGELAKNIIINVIKRGHDLKDLNPKYQEQIIKDVKIASIRAACENVNSLFSSDLFKCSRKILIKTLIIDGEDARLIPISISQKFQKLIPDSQLVLISNATHAVFLQKPEEFNRYILEFLK